MADNRLWTAAIPLAAAPVAILRFRCLGLGAILGSLTAGVDHALLGRIDSR